MASGMTKKKTPEELIAQQGGASVHGKPGETIRITGGVSGSGLYGVESNFPGNRDFRVSDNGRLVIQPGVEEYNWNEKLKRYDAVPGRGRGYLLAENIKPMDTPEEGGPVDGGKFIPTTKEFPRPKPRQVYDKKFVSPLTTDQILGSTKGDMMDWRPTSSNGQGGVQTMNPLVDPNKWMYNGVGPAARKMTLIPI